jgi:hypothetical protein
VSHSYVKILLFSVNLKSIIIKMFKYTSIIVCASACVALSG